MFQSRGGVLSTGGCQLKFMNDENRTGRHELVKSG